MNFGVTQPQRCREQRITTCFEGRMQNQMKFAALLQFERTFKFPLCAGPFGHQTNPSGARRAGFLPLKYSMFDASDQSRYLFCHLMTAAFFHSCGETPNS